MKTVSYLIIGLLVVACTQAEDVETNSVEDQAEAKTENVETEEPVRAKRDSIHTEAKPEAPAQLATYSATWFQIEYPSDFTASPTTPTSVYGDDYHFVETEEATFTSPDGTVEFFIFSPQWGGDPIDYLEQKSSEKVIETKEDQSTDDPFFTVTHTWKTFEDKQGKYTRAYHSIKTESTHCVFGVKYTNRKMYERYKAAYMTFKKSLQQFAD
jgi:trehalose-6-phosphate synthase